MSETVERDERGAERCLVYRVLLNSRVLWLGGGSSPPNVSSLPFPPEVSSDPLLRVDVLYDGYDRKAATTILRLSYQLEVPVYSSDTVQDEQSKFILESDHSVVSLFSLPSVSDLDRSVWKARIFARSRRMRLKHMARIAELHGIEVQRLSDSSIKLTAASRWSILLVNRDDHCLWRADLQQMGLRWRGLSKLKGWNGKDSRSWMMALYDRMLGDEIREYCEPHDRIKANPTFRKWKQNIPIPKSSLRPSMQRSQGWNPSIPYKNWRKALELGPPKIQWL